MITPQKKKFAKKKNFKVPKDCIFCKKRTEPNYFEVDGFKAYVSERGKIIGKSRNGLCAKHQRKVTTEIKRSRLMALTPFVNRIN